MVLVLGGTTEAVEITKRLKQRGFSVYYSKATAYPQKLKADNEKELTKAELEELVQEKQIKVIVDGTHPFAQKIKVVAQQICKEKKIVYLRYERHLAKANLNNCFVTSNLKTAAQKAALLGKKILVLTGVNSLETIIATLKGKDVQLFARVLDWPPSIAKAKKLLGADCFISGHPPFTLEQNLALLETFPAEVMLTKDSGWQGGLREKIKAAQLKNVPVVIVKRPKPFPEAIFSIKTLLAKVEEVTNA